MANDNFTVQIGNLTDDPELRFTQNGTPVTNFGLAVNQRIREADGSWRDGETSFFRVNVWRDQAENTADSLAKGNRAVVVGRLRTRSFETTQGEKRTVAEIDADDVAPSLRWAIAKPERATRTRANTERTAERGQFTTNHHSDRRLATPTTTRAVRLTSSGRVDRGTSERRKGDRRSRDAG